MSSLRSFLLLFFMCLKIYDTSSDNITAKNFLKNPESKVSYNSTLKPTYLSLSNTTNGSYVGSYCNKLPMVEDAWVANKNNPLTNSFSSFQVLNGQKHIVLSPNITVSQAAMNLDDARLLESGNLVLFGANINIIKRSKGNGKNSRIKPGKCPSHPSLERLVKHFCRSKHFRQSKLLNDNTSLGIVVKGHEFQSHWIIIHTRLRRNSSLMLPSPPLALSSYIVLNQGSATGQFMYEKWIILRQAPDNECGIFGMCIFGGCNLKAPVCKCLHSFEPNIIWDVWGKGNQSSGHRWTKRLLCGIRGAKDDGFTIEAKWLEGLDQDTCRSHCLLNRLCEAYAFDIGIGCYIQKIVFTHTRYQAMQGSHIGNNKRRKTITAVASISGTATLVAIVYFLCRRKFKQEKNITLLDILNGNQRLDKFEELPLFKFDKLAAATSNFQDSNKIGQGGFGRVYKGTMEDGQEVAIKRLSGTSRQGIEEFMNEALLISKLQHRNLVKLLGWCVERQERLLIYEYMPNKSLDAFIFDPNKKRILDWRKRYTIVEGICRGLLYLHRDSRLKIIHRDLKAANILLDEDLNPIISDFGMAKIFGTSQSEADTTRVAGTCGYMSPEYAFKGRFSEKSDVFSFGVLLLEIITGKRTRWHDDESSLSLVGYVWKQWTEDNIISLIDPLLAYQDFEAEISKCIHIGLLCVQENAQDRPDISAVILMLSALNTASFQKPNNPPGFTRLMCDTSSTPAQIHQSSSMNGLSISQISCR